MSKILSWDRCQYCQDLPALDANGNPDAGRVYTEARAKWLESAAKQLKDCQGDDKWVDWMAEGKRLDKLEAD